MTKLKSDYIRDNVWFCPGCKRKHTGFREDVCRNELCPKKRKKQQKLLELR